MLHMPMTGIISPHDHACMDSLGNEVTVKKDKTLTAREKKLEKKRAARRQAPLPTHEDED